MRGPKYWLWDKYITLLENAPLQLRAEHYQRRYDGDSVGAALMIPRMVAKGSNQLQEEDLYACYPQKRMLDRRELEEELCKYDVISFDIFDTLLLRLVNRPKDVFGILEKENKLPGFARNREMSERLAREKKFAAEGTHEVTIEDIYGMPAMSAYGSQETLIELELAAEKRSCYAKPEMLGLFERLCSMGKTIVVTSDMYLHTEFIRELLDNSGYHSIEAYFVSCDYGVGKGNGALFGAVREYAGNRTIVHIGDNFYGDVYPLRGSSIVPIHYLAGNKRRTKEKH